MCHFLKLRSLSRYSFNLVEIVLAMAVLAIGISSVLVLFPVGVNANRDAVAGNNMADLAEQVVSQIRAAVEIAWGEDGYSDSDKAIDLPKSKPSLDSIVESDFDTTGDNASLTMIKKEDGVFLFRVLSQLESEEYVAEFSAIVAVWEDTSFNDFYVAKPGADTPEKLTKADLDNFAKVILIEVSWPANLDYGNREKACFRYESFNNKLEPYSAKNSKQE